MLIPFLSNIFLKAFSLVKITFNKFLTSSQVIGESISGHKHCIINFKLSFGNIFFISFIFIDKFFVIKFSKIFIILSVFEPPFVSILNIIDMLSLLKISGVKLLFSRNSTIS